jgi:hypothetical protein
MFCCYVVGASLPAASGFFRKVKKPTAAGTRIKRTDTHNNAYPMVGEKVCGEVPPLVVTSIGVPLAMSTPHTQLMILKHPQKIVVKMVATIPMVLFCMFISPLINVFEIVPNF